jgi:hypothetical protein
VVSNPKELVNLSTITEKKENNKLIIRSYFQALFNIFLIDSNIARRKAVLGESDSQNKDVEEGLTEERIMYDPQERVKIKSLLFTKH